MGLDDLFEVLIIYLLFSKQSFADVPRSLLDYQRPWVLIVITLFLSLFIRLHVGSNAGKGKLPFGLGRLVSTALAHLCHDLSDGAHFTMNMATMYSFGCFAEFLEFPFARGGAREETVEGWFSNPIAASFFVVTTVCTVVLHMTLEVLVERKGQRIEHKKAERAQGIWDKKWGSFPRILVPNFVRDRFFARPVEETFKQRPSVGYSGEVSALCTFVTLSKGIPYIVGCIKLLFTTVPSISLWLLLSFIRFLFLAGVSVEKVFTIVDEFRALSGRPENELTHYPNVSMEGHVAGHLVGMSFALLALVGIEPFASF